MRTRSKPTLFLPGAAVGAFLTYYLDPVSGRRRLVKLASRLRKGLHRLALAAAGGASSARQRRRDPASTPEPAIAGVTDVSSVESDNQATAQGA